MKNNLLFQTAAGHMKVETALLRTLHQRVVAVTVVCLHVLLGTPLASAAAAGTVAAWGMGGWGQTNVPPTLTNAVAVVAGEYHSMALKADGTVVAWGGAGTDYQEVKDVPPGLSGVVAIAAGDALSLALKKDGRVVAWGPNFSGQTNVPATLTNAVAIAAGGYHALALRRDGRVVAWGQNDSGQTNVTPGLSNVVAIAAGGHHSLALKSDGTVTGWGFNGYGQASPPAGLSGVVEISAVDTRSLALKADGTVVQWGRFTDGSYAVPAGLNNVVGIAAGLWHSLALKNDGTVVAWGDAPYATLPPGLANITAIAANRDHSLALVGSAAPTMISAGAIWRFLDNGTDQGAAWRASGFNDSAWAQGRAQLGYGDGDESTVIGYGPDASNRYITTYFRRSFAVNNVAALANLTLRLVRDDGAVVYLNGTEVFRSNLPGGTISSTTLASTGLGSPDENNWQTASINPTLLVNGVNVLTVEVHQVNVTSTDVSFDLELAPTWGNLPPPSVTLISTGAVWKYLDAGADLGAAWREASFNDSAWPSGLAELGYGDGNEATVVSYGPNSNNKYITTYFRRAFVASNVGAITNLNWRLLVDDGAVVYLNGAELFRCNMPAGSVAFNTLAASSGTVTYTGTASPALLVNGPNVLAVEVHQVNVTSTDISFDLELNGFLGSLTLPAIVHQPASQTILAASAASFAVTATGAQPLQYQWRKNGNPITGANGLTLTLTSAQSADAGGYSVAISNGEGSVISATATLTVVLPNADSGCAGSLDPGFDMGASPALWPPWGPQPITAMTVQPDGKIVIAGPFEQVRGTAVSGVARLNANGTLDTGYSGSAADALTHNHATQSDGRIVRIVPQEGGLPPLVQRFLVGGGLDVSFVPALPEGFSARALAVQADDCVLIVGGIHSVDPVTYAQSVAHPIVRLGADGARDAGFAAGMIVGLVPGEWTAGETVAVYDVLVQPDGRIYMGGFFTAVNGVRRQVAARLMSDGAIDPTFVTDVEVHAGHDPGIVETVSMMALAPDGKLYIAGFLEKASGLTRNTMMRLHTAPFSCPGLIAVVDQIAYTRESDSQVVITLTRRANTNTSTSVAYATGPYATQLNPYSFFNYATGGVDYVQQQGVLTFAPGQVIRQVVIPLLNDSLFESTESFNLNLSFATNAPDAAVLVNERASSMIMIWDDESVGLPGSVDETFLSPGFDQGVSALALAPDGTVFVGGSFTHAGALVRRGLVRCAPNGYVTPGFAPVLNGDVVELAIDPQNGQIVVAGTFTSVNGTPRPGLARLNADGTLDASFQPNVSGGVWELASMGNGQMIIAGPFTNVSGQVRQGFARLNHDGSLDATFNAGTGIGAWNTSLRANDLLALSDGKVFVTGWFWTFNGAACQAIVRLNANGSRDTSFNPTIFQAGDYGSELLLQPDGKLLLGGWIRYGLGGIYHVGIVRLLADGSLDPTFLAKTRGEGSPMALQPDGKILLGGTRRINHDGTDDPSWFSGAGFSYGGVAALVVLPNGKVIAGGAFSQVNGFSYPFLACLNGDPTAHLSSALDTTGLTWTTGSHPWFGQTAVSHDGEDAAQSGGNMTCDIHSWLKTTVTGPGTVSFRWKAQIDGAQSFVSFYVVNGSGTWPQAIYLTDSTDWRWETSFFGLGTHDLFWVTYGNCANYDEQVTAWLDEVVVTGPGRESAPFFTTVPTSQIVPPGVNVNFQAIAGGAPIPALQWRFNGTAIPGATNFTLVLTNAQTAQAGLYSVVAINTLGAITNTVTLAVAAGAPVSAPPAQVTGTVELDGFVGVDDGLGNYSGRRIVTFKATDANGVVIKAWNLGLDFTSGADHCGMASFTLTGVPPETAGLSAKTASHLRKRLPVTFTAGQAEMHFIGSALLRAGDVDDSNKVDLNDYFQLAAAWSTGDVAVDLNGDGWVEMADQFILFSRWYQEGDPE